jgi:RNA polymerase sigma-70 factor (sigma-E family)
VKGRSDQRLDEFLQATVPGLLRYATALTGDPHLAADIVQDVLVKVALKWRQIGDLDRPDLYVRRMVTNQHVSWRRKWEVRFIRPSSTGVLHDNAGHAPDATSQVADRQDLLQRLGRLPPQQRAVLVLRYLEGLDDDEIADLLGTTTTTVRSHASRALKRLRQESSQPVEIRR